MIGTAEYMMALREVLSAWKAAEHKLNQFRNHPDWSAALSTVSNNRRDLFIKWDDGRWALPEKNASRLFDLADESFIERAVVAKALGIQRLRLEGAGAFERGR